MKIHQIVAALTVSALLTSCAVGPDFQRLPYTNAPAWNAPLPHGGDKVALAQWWGAWNDATLVMLIAQAQRENPTIAQSAARIGQARATVRAQTASLLPSFTGNASDIRSKGGANGMAGNFSGAATTESERTRSIALDAVWELDLFGGGRRAREASAARASARNADWHDARISIASEVANQYVNLRTCELLLAGYEIDAKSRAETARLTDLKTNAGFEAPANAALSQASAAEARARLILQAADCDVVVKVLAELTALPEPDLRVALAPGKARVPAPRNFVLAPIPAAALSQRPDLAAAEGDLAASMADIGVAIADRLPRLSLTGSIGVSDFSSAGIPDGRTWRWGPSLSLPIFDFGRRAANVDGARARFDESFAIYRGKALRAVREVEEALVRLDGAGKRETDANAALRGYEKYLAATEARVRVGAGSLPELEEARRAVVASQGVAVGVARERLAAWISLYKAIGGGWDATLATPPTPASPV